jgi:aryl-alcohol dehydrogenase-like predicted oxidoreductase
VAEIALRYVLSQDAVSTVIPGLRTVRNAERNAAVGDGRGLSADQQVSAARHRWEKIFYPS